VPVQVRVGGVISNTGTIAVMPREGSACADPYSFGGAPVDTVLRNGSLRAGTIHLTRTSSRFGGLSFTADAALAVFSRLDIGNIVISIPQFRVSQVGSCATYVRDDAQTPQPLSPVAITPLDAGPSLTLTLPGGATRTMTPPAAGQRGLYLASAAPDISLGPGPYRVAGGAATADVKPFSASIEVPAPLVWTASDQVTEVRRELGQEIAWTGAGAQDAVVIAGFAAAQGRRAGAGFSCLVEAARGSFRVPPEVLLALPANTGALSVSSFSRNPGTFTPAVPEGLDSATFLYTFAHSRQVSYR
jgi:hypothetical protein